MKKIISILLAALLLAVLFIPSALADGVGYYYVNTENGRTLNVRNNPNGAILGQLSFGTRIYVQEFTTPEWAMFYYNYQGGEYAAWVSTRYLSKTDPRQKTASNTSAASSTSSASTDAAKILSDMNAEFKTGKLVTSFTVYARPSRASGWVNLRWAPSTETERIATCPQGKALTVIGETKNWYQVQDPETGMIGFIMKKFVSAN